MRSTTEVLLLGALLSLALSAHAAEETDGGTSRGIQLTLDTYSRYVWRGYELSHDDPALLTYLYYSPSFAPGLTVSTGFVAGLVRDEKAGDDETSIDEIDATIAYEHELIPETLTTSVSFLYYGYVSTWTKEVAYGDARDLELNLRLEYGANALFSLFLSYSRGLDDKIEGDHLELGTAASLAWGEDRWSLSPAIVVAYSNQYGTAGKWTYAGLSLPLSYRVGSLSATLSGSYVVPLVDLNADGKDDLFFVGLSVTLDR
ncbi:MAG: hypothetical protein HYV63_13840 [Candidatus Schekmanbacteria bacterium]|nr:hypothetical protein [Candidatus Schekmanbacteria bacterium]